ncbi:MAG TPA: hypothetical protein VFT72_01345 [Opitutaceae bacterium]|nr:hypothetical protein [Opitutaceae bacterium]
MQLDVRLPMGFLFLILGVILTIYGIVGDKAMYVRSLGDNINLTWGIVFAIFGAVVLFLAKRGAKKSE